MAKTRINRRLRQFGTLAGVLITFIHPSLSQATDHVTVAIYSNICWHEEAGDLLGERLFLIRSIDRTYVLFQESIGVLLKPHLGEAVIYEDSIQFKVATISEAAVSFAGNITSEMIAGTFGESRRDADGNIVFFRFMRVPNEDMPWPECSEEPSSN